MNKHPVALEDIRGAASALAGVVVRTHVLENMDVNAMLGGRLLLKVENFQRTGAFKIRGAYNRILNLKSKERARGTVSYSSGNHALGLARAAQMLGSSAIIVMPSDAPAAKIAATRALGAEIVTFDRDDPQFSFPRDIQTEVMNSWFENRDLKDCVIKLNVGSGKTLVGLLMLQSSINEGKGPALYVAPDKQLAQQVMILVFVHVLLSFILLFKRLTGRYVRLPQCLQGFSPKK